MKKIFVSACLFLLPLLASARYDIIVVGGTPGGIMAAVSAAREGKRVLLLERTWHIGGLPANGLGATDIATRGATTGLFREFVERNKSWYANGYGADSGQVRDCADGYRFEPSVAERSFLDMLAAEGESITVLYGRQFDSDPARIEMSGERIRSIEVLNRESGESERYSAEVFIDATYEGDLGAAAGVPFRVGRESRSEFGEVCAGRIYRHWGAQYGIGEKSVFNGYEGYDSEGTTYQGDNAVQAYNYRLCLTRDRKNSRTVKRPASYDREEYASLAEDVWTGRHTGTEMLGVAPEEFESNRAALKKGGVTRIPGDPWGISKITNMVELPNGKTDANNQHMAFLSTDLPEENWPWPTASWEWRDAFARRLKDYTLGLLWFVQNDRALPPQFRKACREWGLSSTEYSDNDNFPRQVYVREGRRFEGQYFFTAADALPVTPGGRPPLHETSVTSSHYALDSHAVRKRESGRVHLDGFFSYETKPYTVPFGVMVPDKIENLLFPVPVSGSHVGFSTIRMEPCWMALGQAAGAAAAQAADRNLPVQALDIPALQDRLLDGGATLVYFRDMRPDSPYFKMVQKMALKGYLPGWDADLDSPASAEDRDLWSRLSGEDIPENLVLRGEILRYISLNSGFFQNF